MASATAAGMFPALKKLVICREAELQRIRVRWIDALERLEDARLDAVFTDKLLVSRGGYMKTAWHGQASADHLRQRHAFATYDIQAWRWDQIMGESKWTCEPPFSLVSSHRDRKYPGLLLASGLVSRWGGW